MPPAESQLVSHQALTALTAACPLGHSAWGCKFSPSVLLMTIPLCEERMEQTRGVLTLVKKRGQEVRAARSLNVLCGGGKAALRTRAVPVLQDV